MKKPSQPEPSLFEENHETETLTHRPTPNVQEANPADRRAAPVRTEKADVEHLQGVRPASLEYRTFLADQIVRDMRAIASGELAPECPGVEFFEQRIIRYREAIAEIDAYQAYLNSITDPRD